MSDPPLGRDVDRRERAAVTGLVLIGLFLVPIALVFGWMTYASIADQGRQEAATRVAAVATLTEDSAPAIPTAHGVSQGTAEVSAEWRTPNGVTHTGTVTADDGLRAGAKVEIWLDRDGRVVDAPVTSFGALVAAVLVIIAVSVTAACVLTLVRFGLRLMFDHRRFRDWEQEWAQVEPDWAQRLR